MLGITDVVSGASVGQAHAPGIPWPMLQVRTLSRSLNLETAASASDLRALTKRSVPP